MKKSMWEFLNRVYSARKIAEVDLVIKIALDRLVSYRDYPFKLYEGKKLEELMESIKNNGLLNPIVVRPIRGKNGYFEILSGHNRVNAVKMLNLVEIASIVKEDLTDLDAEYIFIKNNRDQQSFASRTTYMTDNDKIREIHRLQEILFKIVLKKELPEIVDYSLLNNNLSWPENATSFLWNNHGKTIKTITSVHELRKIFEELVLSVRHLYYENILHFIEPDDIAFAVNQLVIDTLYNKYICDSEMTLNEYCAKHLHFEYRNDWLKLSDLGRDEAFFNMKETVYKMMGRNKEYFIKALMNPMVKSSIKKLYNHDKYVEYIEKINKKSKAVWDSIWYQYNLPVVMKLFNQASYGDSEEEQRQFANDLNNYEKFVKAAFTPKDGDNKDYFHKSMGFYHLESFSMMEAIYKFAEKTMMEEIDNMDASDFFYEILSIEEITLPYMQKTESGVRLRFSKNFKIYRNPLSNSDYELIDRAQAHELFNYYYKFESDNYDEISEFIKQNYNTLDNYYEKDKIWNVEKTQKIINVIFSAITKEYIDWLKSIGNEDIDNNKNKDFENLFGMDEATFEKNLSILKRETKKIRRKGGKKSKLSDYKQLLIAIECDRSLRTMDEIAKKYDVSKSTISEVNKRVSEILKKYPNLMINHKN